MTVADVNAWLKRQGVNNVRVIGSKFIDGIKDIYEVEYKAPGSKKFETIFVGWKPEKCAQYINKWLGVPVDW